MTAPLIFRYEGEGNWSAASAYWARRADIAYVVGETYSLIPHEVRSQASHNHYFARINEAWETLPDGLLAEYPTPDHLRKKMLVRAGYADERSIVCQSKAEAQRVAAFIKPMDEYAVVVVREAVVRVYTAQSQKLAAMGKKAFQESKDKVLDAIDALLGVEPQERGEARAA